LSETERTGRWRDCDNADRLWGVIFFFASATSSSTYLTVSEIFPLELRGLAIALFYSSGMARGGPLSSWLFGRLIDNGRASPFFTATWLRPRAFSVR
jgi:hypothetical protein